MQALIFDLDDTLYTLNRHRDYHLRRAWQPWLATLPIQTQTSVIAAAVSQRIFFRDMADFLRSYDIPEHLNQQLCQQSRDTWFSDLTFDQGVEALLDMLATRYRLALITNGPSWTQRAKIDQLQLSRWFECMVVSGEYGVEKPDPRIFAHVLDQLGIDATDAIMIGDNPEADIRGAHAVGMRAIWITHPHLPYPDDLAPAWQCVTHVTQIAGILEVE
ncbi:MAG: HAD family hydrolase [Chloroflexota bacterium]|jgi:HAD superfamily hydrolase (TIGR01549 family)